MGKASTGIPALAAAAALALCLFTPAAAPVYAVVNGVTLKQGVSVVNAMQGDSRVSFDMELENISGQNFSDIGAEVGSPKGFSGARLLSGDGPIANWETKTYVFVVDIDSGAGYGSHYLPVTLYYDVSTDKKELAFANAIINVSRNISSPSVAGFEVPLLDMAYRLEGGDSLKAGETNTLSITVTNRGNLMLQDVQATLVLPDLMSIDNSFAVQYLGYLGVGESRTVKFPVLVDEKAENRNHSVSVKLSGLSKGSAASFERAIYMPVTGGEEKASSGDIEIGDVSLPPSVDAGADFLMGFSVGNVGKADLENLKIDVSPEAGLTNKSRNVFIEPLLGPGESKTYSVAFFSDKDVAADKSYPIKISAEAGTGDSAVSASQYASVFLNKTTSAGAVKTPQLIVDNYSFGKESVMAGESFSLAIELYNTSPREILNIKVSLSAESGAFVPVGSSNSFFIERMAAKERVSRSMTMAAGPDAEQRTTALNATMTYEDEDGNAFQATDVISIPVMQETSLTIDDIIAPPELYPGMQSGIDVRFYNTGKTQLRNLRVTAEGDFDASESTSYYAGNMASGANDRYSFSFIPRAEGSLNGKLVFTYDDPSGEEQAVEKEFSFQVMPPMDFGDEAAPDESMDAPKSRAPLYIGIGVAVAALIALLALRRFLKRRKLHRDMEIEDGQL
ncbi:MAG: hypothetical protein LBS32_02445 [Clostridiales Family XIII bacterium]|jgi:hypothetical protein|nr:hypothetical protein [Clostridiales Family XIII bacterium]